MRYPYWRRLLPRRHPRRIDNLNVEWAGGENGTHSHAAFDIVWYSPGIPSGAASAELQCAFPNDLAGKVKNL